MKFSQRKIDKERESRVRYILDAIYATEGIAYWRPEDLEFDKRGVDVVLKSEKSDNLLWVDEKCATHYWDKPLETYSCELTCQKNKRHLGWFAEEANNFYGTTHYMFAWIRTLEPELIHVSSLELCMVSKHDLQTYFRMAIGFSSGTPTADIIQHLKTKRIVHAGALKIKQCKIYE